MQQQMEELCTGHCLIPCLVPETSDVGAAARGRIETKDAKTQSGNAAADGSVVDVGAAARGRIETKDARTQSGNAAADGRVVMQCWCGSSRRIETKDARTQSGNAEADGCKQAMLVRQLEEELRLRMRGPSLEMQQQMEVLFAENEHLTREIAILRETIKRSLSVILAGTFPGCREQVAHPDMHAALGTCNLGDLRLSLFLLVALLFVFNRTSNYPLWTQGRQFGVSIRHAE
ncbi:ethionine resistance protein [Homalodisca vitripennis]|nr:ethionine resistance protein [Homalodisca vitripennis]